MIEIRDIAREVVRKYGMEKQLSMAQEECAELIVAISHYKRGRRIADAEVKEEMADVAFMIYQLMEMTCTTSTELARMIVRKYEKLKEKEETKNV